MHGLLTGQESRQQLYTMLTHVRHANHLYLQAVGDGDPHTVIRPDAISPRTPSEMLQQIVLNTLGGVAPESLKAFRESSAFGSMSPEIVNALQGFRGVAPKIWDALRRAKDQPGARPPHPDHTTEPHDEPADGSDGRDGDRQEDEEQ